MTSVPHTVFKLALYALFALASASLGATVALATPPRLSYSVPNGSPVTQVYRWSPSNGAAPQTLAVSITQDELARASAYRARFGGSYSDLLNEAVAELDDTWPRSIRAIAATTRQRDYEVAADFVQNAIPWSPQEGAAYLPSTLLQKHSGDCDDLATLLGALLIKLGYEQTVLWLDRPDSHMAVASRVPVPAPPPDGFTMIDGERFVFIEPTAPAPFGRIPKNFPHWRNGRPIARAQLSPLARVGAALDRLVHRW